MNASEFLAEYDGIGKAIQRYLDGSRQAMPEAESLTVEHWSGNLAGANASASDVFTRLTCDGEWKITYKLFYWHDR